MCICFTMSVLLFEQKNSKILFDNRNLNVIVIITLIVVELINEIKWYKPCKSKFHT